MSADEAFLWTVVLGASALLFLPHFNADTLVPRREYGVYEDAKRINNCVHTYVGRRELAFCFVKTFAAQLFILYSPSRVHRIISYASWSVATQNLCTRLLALNSRIWRKIHVHCPCVSR